MRKDTHAYTRTKRKLGSTLCRYDFVFYVCLYLGKAHVYECLFYDTETLSFFKCLVGMEPILARELAKSFNHWLQYLVVFNSTLSELNSNAS